MRARRAEKLRRWTSLVWGCLALGVMCSGCLVDASVEASGGDERWMSQCQDDADCGDYLACLCGVCAQLCAGPVCGPRTPGECVSADRSPVQRLCAHAGERARAVCMPRCVVEADCGVGLRCLGGICEVSECEDYAQRSCLQNGKSNAGLCREEGRGELCVDGLYAATQRDFAADLERLTLEGVDVKDYRAVGENMTFCGDATLDLCDGEDNDCDGATDEDAASTEPCAMGEGVCFREGALSCSAGVYSCSVGLGEKQEGLCDREDDDCDGKVDEFSLGQGAALGDALRSDAVGWSFARLDAMELIALEVSSADGSPRVQLISSPGTSDETLVAEVVGSAPQLVWHRVGLRTQVSLFYLEPASAECSECGASQECLLQASCGGEVRHLKAWSDATGGLAQTSGCVSCNDGALIGLTAISPTFFHVASVGETQVVFYDRVMEADSEGRLFAVALEGGALVGDRAPEMVSWGVDATPFSPRQIRVDALDDARFLAALTHDVDSGERELLLAEGETGGEGIALSVVSDPVRFAPNGEAVEVRSSSLALRVSTSGDEASAWVAWGVSDFDQAQLRVRAYTKLDDRFAVVRDERMTRTVVGWRLALPSANDPRFNAPLASSSLGINDIFLRPFCDDGHCDDFLLAFGEHHNDAGQIVYEVHAEVVDPEDMRVINSGGWFSEGQVSGLRGRGLRLLSGPPEGGQRWGTLLEADDGGWTPYLGEIRCDAGATVN